MKSKFIATLLLVSVTCTHTLYPSRANAVVGIATSVPVLEYIGLSMFVAGTARAAVGSRTRSRKAQAVAIGCFIAGIVLLNNQETTVAEFAPIKPKDARKLGITREEREEYNRDLPLLN